MTRITRLFALLVPALLILIATGCAAATQHAAVSYESAAMDAPTAAESGDYDRVDLGIEEMEDGIDRKMISTAAIDLIVGNTGAMVEEITALVEEAGGYIADSNFYQRTYGEQDFLQGSMTIRVPAGALDGTLQGLAGMAVEVINRSVNRQDVTEQYFDLDARLRNLEATETELLALLTEVRAKPDAEPEDILTVHRSLMEIRGQIEQLQGRKNLLDNQIALSTIHVSLQPDTSTLPIVEESWQPAAAVNNALRALVGSMQTLGSAAIWFVLYVAPILLTILLPLALVTWALLWIGKRLRQRPAMRAA